jgi:signal transduction histidine kinase
MSWLERTIAHESAVHPGSPIAYVIAFLLVMAGLALRFVLSGELVGLHFMFFFAAVVIASWIGGLGPGLLATALGGVCAWLALFPPYWRFAATSLRDSFSLGLFVLVSVTCCVILQGFHSVIEHLREARRREKAFADSLEFRIAERTRELAESNDRLRSEIAERERAEVIARQMQKMELVGQMAGGVAHDFNNLLAAISGSVESASARLHGRAREVEPFLATASAACERAITLTQRLLSFSRRQPIEPALVDGNELIRDLFDMIRRTMKQGIDIRTELAADLWPTCCDANQFEMALLNLAVNSRDAMPSGGSLVIETKNIRLDVENDEPGGSEWQPYVMIAVTDTGTGMSRETIARAMEPFYTTKASGEGTGLGLTLVFDFVRHAGGQVTLESELDRGTTVRLYLPGILTPSVQPAARGAAARGAEGLRPC